MDLSEASGSGKRDAKAGMTLIVVRLWFVIVVSLVVSVQRTVLAQARVLDRIVDVHGEGIAELSLRAHLMPLVLESMVASDLREEGPVPLNGRAVEVSVDGRGWTVEVQAVSGVPNLLSTPLGVLNTLYRQSLQVATKAARNLPPTRVLSEQQFLARSVSMALDGDGKINLRGFSERLADQTKRLPRTAFSDDKISIAVIRTKL